MVRARAEISGAGEMLPELSDCAEKAKGNREVTYTAGASAGN
jgi:hypothetical protein